MNLVPAVEVCGGESVTDRVPPGWSDRKVASIKHKVVVVFQDISLNKCPYVHTYMQWQKLSSPDYKFWNGRQAKNCYIVISLQVVIIINS